MHIKNTIALVILFCAITFKVKAQENNSFERIKELSTNAVYCVMQDSKGFIWAGTEEGVAKYDGYKITMYTIDDGLPSNDVFQIKEDALGRLWFLNNSGKPCLYDNGKILTAQNTAWLATIQPTKLAISFLQLPHKTIWYATLDTAYKIVDSKVVSKVVVPVANSNIQRVFVYKSNTYVLHNKGIYCVESKNDYALDIDKQLQSNHTKSFVANNLLYFININSIICIDINNFSYTIIHSFPANENPITFINFNRSDSVLITTNQCIYQLIVKAKKLKQNSKQCVGYITDILKDDEGNIWQTSFASGLSVYRIKNKLTTQKLVFNNIPNDASCWSFFKINNNLCTGFDAGYWGEISNNKLIGHRLKLCNTRKRIYQILQYNHLLLFANAEAMILQVKNTEYLATIYTKQIEAANSHFILATTNGILKVKKLLQSQLILSTASNLQLKEHIEFYVLVAIVFGQELLMVLNYTSRKSQLTCL